MGGGRTGGGGGLTGAERGGEGQLYRMDEADGRGEMLELWLLRFMLSL